MNTPKAFYLQHRFPPEINSYLVCAYHRFGLSVRDVEDLLAERGIIVSYELIRCGPQKFTQPSLPSDNHGVVHRGQGELALCSGSECDADACLV